MQHLVYQIYVEHKLCAVQCIRNERIYIIGINLLVEALANHKPTLWTILLMPDVQKIQVGLCEKVLFEMV